MLRDLPVFGVSGYSGSGKTTLIEKIVPELKALGLRILVLKHDIHGFQIDTQGKDTDRFFDAGSDVLALSINDGFLRYRINHDFNLESALQDLCLDYDLVLIEGFKHAAIDKVWLLDDEGQKPGNEISNILRVVPRDVDRKKLVLGIISDWLEMRGLKSPIFGCVLIGGQSRRMGRPKHLITEAGVTWLEMTISQLSQVVDRVIIVGAGQVPEHLCAYTRLPDITAIKGPLAGVLSAMRWNPQVSWLVCACDMPNLSVDALKWLVSCKTPGVWGILPRLGDSKKVEPLMAYYDSRARKILENQIVDNNASFQSLAANPKIEMPLVPPTLTTAWKNINTERDIHSV